jgi:hypothetical protein
VLLVVLWGVHAFAQGARPIEFSESRGGSSTNAPVPGSERSRLDSLEAQISKSLDIFKPDDSLSGSRVPLPRPPVRSPGVTPESQRRGGLFDEDEAWIRADPLAGRTTLQDMLEVDLRRRGEDDRRSGQRTGSKAERPERSNTKSSDEGFWEFPLNTSTLDDVVQARPSEDLYLRAPRSEGPLEGLFAAQSPEAAFEYGQPESFSGFREDPAWNGRSPNSINPLPYRLPTGFKPSSDWGNDTANSRSEQPRTGWEFETFRSSPWGGAEPPRALAPVRIPEPRSWLPQMPALPQGPSIRSLNEIEEPGVPTAEPAPRSSSPFRDPVRRGY